ncbi:MAG TPA: voltage-gated chloride channel protein, partial [Terrisporobacter glycolicus]
GLVIIVAIIIIGNRQYLGLSLDLLNNAFQSPVFYGAFIIKLVLTAITLGSGFQGGEVTPLFVIGATLGNALSSIVNLPISFMAGVGMIGVFAGATRTPIASFIMGVELFGGIDIRYLFVACAISYVFSGRSTIYTAQKNELLED